MHGYFKISKKSALITLTLILGLLSLNTQVAIGGIFDNYASIKPSSDLEFQAKSNQLSKDYNYYTGREDLPWAVIGIDSKYELKSKFWHKVESHEQVSEKINHLMPVLQATHVTYGKIGDSSDIQVGVWFSEYAWGISQFEEGNKITAISPYTPNDNE